MQHQYIKVRKLGGTSLTIENITSEKSGDGVMVSWDSLDASSNTAAYELWKKVNEGEWVLHTNITVANFFGFVIDLDVTEGNTYHYRVRAKKDDEVVIGYSAETSITLETSATVPDAPTNIVATVISSTQVDIDWDAPANDGGSPVTGYRIDRSVNGTWALLTANTGNTNTTYSDTTLSAGDAVIYQVTAINSVGNSLEGSVSNTVTTTSGTVPAIPTGFTATTVGDNAVSLSWDDPVDPSITGYNIDRRPDGGVWANIVANTGNQNLFYLDNDGLTPATTYWYRIAAINANGSSGDTAEVSAITSNVGASDSDFLAVKSRVETAGGTVDDNFLSEVISYFKSIGKYDSNLHFAHKSSGCKLDVNGKVEILFDIGPNPFDLTAPTEANRAALDADTKWMTFTGSTFYTMGANYPYATTGMNLGVVAKSGGGTNVAFIIDFGSYVGAGYGLVVGQNDIRSYLPNKNQLYAHGGVYNTEKTIVEMRVVLNNATGFKTFKDNEEIVSLTTSSTTVLDATNITESSTRLADSGPFTFGASAKTSQAGRTYQGITGGFQFYGAVLTDVEAEGLNEILANFYGIGGVIEPPPNPDFTLERVSYRSMNTSSGKHLMFQRYLCPAYLADPVNANVKTVIWAGGQGTNGVDDIAALTSVGEDGFPKYIVHEAAEYPFNIMSIQQTGGFYSLQDVIDVVAFCAEHINNYDVTKNIPMGWSGGNLPATALKAIPNDIDVSILFDPAYDMVGPATTPASIAGGARVLLVSDAQSSYVGGMDTYWNALQGDVNFDPLKHKYIRYATGNHNNIRKTFEGTGGALSTPDDGYTAVPPFSMIDFILGI